MIDALPDHGSRPADESPVRWFQRTRGLKSDNIAGPITRRALVLEYMTLAGKPLPSSVAVSAHGCGESFPLHATGDGVADEDSRRVEAYFFDSAMGAQPPAPGANSKPGSSEYPEWVKRSRRTEDHGANEGREFVRMRLHDGYTRPMPYARAAVTIANATVSMDADADGFIHILLPNVCRSRILVQWGPPDSTEPLRLKLEVALDCDSPDRAIEDRNRLHNLGYGSEDSLEDVAIAFQLEYGVDLDADDRPLGLEAGVLPPASYTLLRQIYEGDCNANRERG